jgi:PAS domain S-box-containing protein
MDSYRTLWGQRVNGQEFPIEASISRFEAEDGNKVLTFVIRDITERHKAEEAMRESEQRFRLLADTAPVMIWMSGADRLCNYFSKPWLEFTGRSFAEEAGNGWAEGVHGEDLQRCMNTYTQSFDQRQGFRMEYRLRRYDGEYRWILDIGVPRFNWDGAFAGYIGIGVDITERKRLEPIVAGIPRKLVEAQEQERARIARDLHDDVGQRLAMLVIECGLIEENHPDLPAEALSSLRELRQQMADVLRDMQVLCHELHSSRLEYIGLVGAMRSWCREAAERRGLEITFNNDDIKNLPQETSLCLFRVLQEAVHNAAKHSGTKLVEVQLRKDSGDIHLVVSDLGKGFDLEAVRQGQGLGLSSMQERVRLVNGTIEIRSKPMGGTTIDVRVPFGSSPAS